MKSDISRSDPLICYKQIVTHYWGEEERSGLNV